MTTPRVMLHHIAFIFGKGITIVFSQIFKIDPETNLRKGFANKAVNIMRVSVTLRLSKNLNAIKM